MMTFLAILVLVAIVLLVATILGATSEASYSSTYRWWHPAVAALQVMAVLGAMVAGTGWLLIAAMWAIGVLCGVPK